MTPEVQARIFEPFFTTKPPGKGTGLGLSTVFGIVKQSGGSILVASESGRGTTFRLYFPLVQEAADRDERSQAHPKALKGSETVLVVEDEDLVRTFVRTVLQAHGYTVLEAKKGGEALRVCEQYSGPIHLMVTDVVLPEMSGIEVADRLVSLYPGMKALYVSGYTDDAIVHRGLIDQGTALLQKPFTPTVLLHKVREVLDTSPTGS
jgi:CheY-like chemotaxis protein